MKLPELIESWKSEQCPIAARCARELGEITGSQTGDLGEAYEEIKHLRREINEIVLSQPYRGEGERSPDSVVMHKSCAIGRTEIIRFGKFQPSPLLAGQLDAFRKMHRRAQRAEGEAIYLRRKLHGNGNFWDYDQQRDALISNLRKEVERLKENPEDAEIRWSAVEPPPAPMMVVLRDKQTVKEWAENRIAPAPEIFEAHGVEWYLAGPASTPPCPREQIVKVLFSNWQVSNLDMRAGGWAWGYDAKLGCDGEYLIKGWRPADAPAKLPRNLADVVAHPVRPNVSACGQCADKVPEPNRWIFCHKCGKRL